MGSGVTLYIFLILTKKIHNGDNKINQPICHLITPETESADQGAFSNIEQITAWLGPWLL